MVFRADIQELFDLAKAFGPQGIEAALDLSEGAVKGATKAAEAKMRSCLSKAWPKSNISKNVRTKFTARGESVTGVVSVHHQWSNGQGGVKVQVLGENVPSHAFRARTSAESPYVMVVGKKGEPKKYKSGPTRGKGPPVFIRKGFTHPGYRGAD